MLSFYTTNIVGTYNDITTGFAVTHPCGPGWASGRSFLGRPDFEATMVGGRGGPAESPSDSCQVFVDENGKDQRLPVDRSIAVWRPRVQSR